MLALLLAAAAPSPARADVRDWLRSKNAHVERGNEKMAAGDAKGALPHYDKAARELPAEGGVHLDRGLALLATGDVARAREALRHATQPPALMGVRADAHYDLGLSFYREADALAGKEQHEEAQQLFREAADAFRQSLRLRPRHRDAAWNLELAARRIREEEEKQKQKEQEPEDKKDEKEQEEQGDPQKDQQQEPQKTEQEKQDDQKEQKQQDPQKSKSEPQKQNQQKQDQQKQDEQPQPQPNEKQEQAEPRPLPADVGRALDALQDSGENLERLKARMRAQTERRAPEKDW